MPERESGPDGKYHTDNRNNESDPDGYCVNVHSSSLHLSKVRLPKVRLPKVRLPKVRLPKVRLPKIQRRRDIDGSNKIVYLRTQNCPGVL
jgi:hypothetical protein